MTYLVMFDATPGTDGRRRAHSLPVPSIADPWDRAWWVAQEMRHRAWGWRPTPIDPVVWINADTGRGVVLSNGRPMRRFRIEEVDGVLLLPGRDLRRSRGGHLRTGATGTDG